MIFQIWYMRPDWFAAGILGGKPDLANLDATHIRLKDVEVDRASRDEALEAVFYLMQGEVWSPNGEARALIRAKGLAHTSMSVGDIAIDDSGAAFLVSFVGFDHLGERK